MAIEEWVDYDESLPHTHTTKISKSIQGNILKSQLNCKAPNLCSALTKDELELDNGVNLIVNAIYQRDSLTVFSEAYEGFNNLLNKRRCQNEGLKNFEVRISAAVTKLNSLSKTT